MEFKYQLGQGVIIKKYQIKGFRKSKIDGHIALIQNPFSKNPIFWISQYPGADAGYSYMLMADNHATDDGSPYEGLLALNPYQEDDLIFLPIEK